jgi:hypothetical protein
LQGGKRKLFPLFAAHLPSKVQRAILNCGTHICFNLNSQSECQEMYSPLMLNNKKQQEELGKLPVGGAIICRHRAFPEPVRFTSISIQLSHVDDEQVDMFNEVVLEELSKDVLILDFDLNDYLEVNGKVAKNGREKRSRSTSFDKLMRYIIYNPGLFKDEIAAAWGMDPATAGRYMNKAVKNGWIEPVEIRYRGVGKNPSIAKLTEKGEQYFGLQQKWGKCGPEHHRWQYFEVRTSLCRKFPEPEHSVQVEYLTGDGKFIDVVVLKGFEKKVAVEIELPENYDHVCDNLQKCLKAGFEMVVCALPTDKHIESARKVAEQRLSREELNRVKFVKLSAFIEKKPA